MYLPLTEPNLATFGHRNFQSPTNGIRQHWEIENRLHWVKDVTFGEDAAPLSNYNAATNWSIIRNIALNLARKGGYDSLTKAQRFLAHDIDKLFLLLE